MIMATHSLGANTRNASINFQREELDSLRQVAARLVNAGFFRSVSAAYRHFMLAGAALYDPSSVSLGLRDLRNAAACAALLALLVAQVLFGHDDPALRARRGRSAMRMEMKERSEMEVV